MSIALEGSKLGEVPFGKLVPNPDNIREDLGDIEGLARSIEGAGLITPIAVREQEDGKFMIIAGHRRHAALKFLKTKADVLVQATITDLNGIVDPATMLVENLMREDISPLDESKGISMLLELGLNQKQIASRTGMSAGTISSRATLAKLPVAFHPDFTAGYLPLGLVSSFVKLLPHIPEEVQAELIESEANYNNAKPKYNDIILRTERKLVIDKGEEIATTAGFEVFRSEANVIVPEDKQLLFVESVDDVKALKPKDKQVIVTAGPHGEPRYRPIRFGDPDESETMDDGEKARRAKERARKADRLEFWQGIVGGRLRRNEVLESVALSLFGVASNDAYRIALRILELKPEGEKDETKDYRTPLRTFAAGSAANDNKAMLALVAGDIEARSHVDYTPEHGVEITNFWG